MVNFARVGEFNPFRLVEESDAEVQVNHLALTHRF
jgi:hypothetical protein